MPHLHDFAQNLYGKKYFSKINLTRAYHQIPVYFDDVPKTAIITLFELFEFLFVPFGLKCPAQTFQRFMYKVLCGFAFAFDYIDNILIGSSSVEEHAEHLNMVFSHLTEYSIRINVDKCDLGIQELSFLSYLFNEQGITQMPERVAPISNYYKPKTVRDLRQYLGLFNY